MIEELYSAVTLPRIARALALFLTRRANLYAALVALVVLVFGPQPTQAAVTEAWVHRYSNVASNSVEQASKVVADAAGDIIVTGTTGRADDALTGRDMLTIKYSGANGSVVWQQRYNGPGNAEDSANALAVDSRGNVVLAGTSRNESGADYYTAKYAAADGALLWEQRYNGPVNSSWWNSDYALAVAVDGSGNVVVTGGSNGSGGSPDYYTFKYTAADGAPLWERRYNGTEDSTDQANAVAVDGKGNVVVTGFSNGGASGADYYTAKYAAGDGSLLWEKRYNGPANNHDFADAIASDGRDTVAVTGISFNGTGTEAATVVYRKNLSPLSVDLVSTGLLLRFTGAPGRSYNIERAPDVTRPWSTITTQTPASGFVEYQETNLSAGAAFYRVSEP